MSYRLAFFVTLGLCAAAARAEGPVAPAPRRVPDLCLQLACKKVQLPYQGSQAALLLPESPFPKRADIPVQPFPAEQEQHPLARYHFVHNPRLHPYAVAIITSLYSQRPQVFRHWYSPAVGMTVLNLARQRFALGVEMQRVVLFEEERRYAGTFHEAEPCYAIPSRERATCFWVPSFREGDRRYSVTFRWNLNPARR